jgi:hypothetical protein
MKTTIAIILILFVAFSCKKEKDESLVRCGTSFAQPEWAKKFSIDSLYSFTNIEGVLFSRQNPTGSHWDTIYNLTVPIKFMSNGAGVLDNTVTFNYRLELKYPYPELIITNLNDLSSVYPFANSILSQSGIGIRIENYSDKGGQFILDNGVKYPLTTVAHEESYISVIK